MEYDAIKPAPAELLARILPAVKSNDTAGGDAWFHNQLRRAQAYRQYIAGDQERRRRLLAELDELSK